VRHRVESPCRSLDPAPRNVDLVRHLLGIASLSFDSVSHSLDFARSSFVIARKSLDIATRSLDSVTLWLGSWSLLGLFRRKPVHMVVDEPG